MSEVSSLLSDDKFIEKRRNERFAYLLGVFTQFLWALNSFQMKTYNPSFPECFSNNSVILWRSIPVMVIGYCLCKYRNIRITPHREVKHLFWFYVRHFGNYFCVILNLTVLSYFRLSTSRVFFCCQPIVVTYLSIIVLNEKFYLRYLIGIIICFFGSTLIVLNDKKPQSKTTILHDNIYAGLFFAILFLITLSINTIGQKMMANEKMPPDVQNFYLGFYNILPALFMCIKQGYFAFGHIKYILYCMSNGFLFYLANYCTSVCYKYIAISKFIPVTYLNIVFTFLLSIFVLGEPLFFTDLVGASLIIGFQFWNITNPPGRSVVHIDNHDNHKEKFINDMKEEDNKEKEEENEINKISNKN
jgi:drug/metabolite transporter (DMT)-like permease